MYQNYIMSYPIFSSSRDRHLVIIIRYIIILILLYSTNTSSFFQFVGNYNNLLAITCNLDDLLVPQICQSSLN